MTDKLRLELQIEILEDIILDKLGKDTSSKLYQQLPKELKNYLSWTNWENGEEIAKEIMPKATGLQIENFVGLFREMAFNDTWDLLVGLIKAKIIKVNI